MANSANLRHGTHDTRMSACDSLTKVYSLVTCELMAQPTYGIKSMETWGLSHYSPPLPPQNYSLIDMMVVLQDI